MRRSMCLLTALAAVLVSVVAVGPAAAASCSNEAFRLGSSSLLPECRAYEMVSPVAKGGGDVYPNLPAMADESGSAVEFFSNSSFADSQGAPLAGAYVARRGATEWSTESVDAPQENLERPLYLPSPASSPDLSKTIEISRIALTPGAIAGGTNIYLRDNLTGIRTLVVALPGTKLFTRATQAGANALVVGGSSDWSHILLSSRYPLTPEAPENTNNLYDFTGGSLHLVNYVPVGGTEEIAGGATAVTHSASTTGALPYAHAISGDGRRIFFEVNGSIYMREDGARTVPISVSQIPGEEGTVEGGEGPVANAAGTVVDFLSFAALVPGTACGSGTLCLYSYDVESGRMTALTPAGGPTGPGVEGITGVGGEGSIVYFTSPESLAGAPAAEPGVTTNLYVVDEGTIHFIGQTKAGDLEGTGPHQSEVSPDGRFLAFAGFSPMTPEDVSSPFCPSSIFEPHEEGDCRDVYLYSLATETLTCVSCGTEPGDGDSNLGGQAQPRPANLDDEYPRAVLNDGTVYFDTPNRLVRQDVNSVDDVYAFRGGTRMLISGGATEAPAHFADATERGEDVLFTTAAPLVGQDIDQNIDVYDARIEGGLAGQWPSEAASPCVGEACRPSSPSAPAALGFGSGVSRSEPCAGPLGGAGAASRKATRLSRRARDLASGGARARDRAKQFRHKAKVERRRAERLRKQAKSCQGVGR